MPKQKITKEQVTSSVDIGYLKQINNNLGYMYRLEQLDYNQNKKVKYQTDNQKNKSNPENNTEETKNYEKNRKGLLGGSGILGDLVGFFAKMATALVVYKVVDWISKPENKENVVKLLKLTKGITDFVMGFVDGAVKVLGGTVGGITNVLSGTYKAFTDFLGGISELGNFLTAFPVETGAKFITALGAIPDNFAAIQKNIQNGLFGGIAEAAEIGTKEAQTHISSSIVESATKDDSGTEKPIVAGDENNIVPVVKPESVTPVETPKIPTEKTVNASKDIQSVAQSTTAAAVVPQQTELPKLAKGGIVSTNSTAPDIKPLSTLTDLNSNNKFTQEVKDIIPDFTKLMKLPFTVIGTGIVSILQSSISNNPEIGSTIAPVLNSIGRLFNVSTDNSNVNVFGSSSSDKLNNTKDKSNGVNTNLLDIFGKTSPSINSSDTSGAFNSSNDTSVRGLLADILNAFTMKSNMNTPAEATSSSTPQKASGGWIHGPQTGYPVSLDGKGTDFIGHGTEWVGQHDSKSSAFVVPFDTPSTRSNKGLTGKRMQEASRAGYGMPQMASGGELSKLVKPIDSDMKSSGFGMRFHPIHREWRMHKGTDYGIPVGTPVKSAGVGTVTTAGTVGGYGYSVYIKHPNGEETRYAHLSQIDVKVGQQVAQGTQIGLSGGKRNAIGSGTSTGPHLHFETRNASGEAVDPVKRVGSGQVDTSTVAANSSTSIMSASAPQEKDWGKIGESFTTLTQMLGISGGNKDIPKSEPKNQKSKLPTRASGGEVKNKVLVNRTGSKDSYGLEKLNVRVFGKDGKVLTTLTANSGKPGRQKFVGAGQSESGSKMPFEFGNYSIGGDMGGSPVNKVGKTFMPLNPNFKTKRSAIGAHVDADRTEPDGAGSVGCLSFANVGDFNKFHSAVRSSGINKLEFQQSNDSSTSSSDSDSTATNPQVATTVTAVQQAPPEKDWGKINEGFKTLTQMLGLGIDNSKPTVIKPQTTANSKIKAVTNPKIQQLNTTPNIKNNKKSNTQILKTSTEGTNTNASSSTSIASVSFDFNSDAYRFTALGSVFGDITTTVGV